MAPIPTCHPGEILTQLKELVLYLASLPASGHVFIWANLGLPRMGVWKFPCSHTQKGVKLCMSLPLGSS